MEEPPRKDPIFRHRIPPIVAALTEDLPRFQQDAATWSPGHLWRFGNSRRVRGESVDISYQAGPRKGRSHRAFFKRGTDPRPVVVQKLAGPPGEVDPPFCAKPAAPAILRLRMMSQRFGIVFVICGIGTALGGGCASGPYQFGRGWPDGLASCSPQDAPPQLEIAEGRPNRFVDSVGWVIGIPGKLLLWDRRVNNHCITPETTEAIARYAEQNHLNDACLRINQYARPARDGCD